jgi:hypothetical protein
LSGSWSPSRVVDHNEVGLVISGLNHPPREQHAGTEQRQAECRNADVACAGGHEEAKEGEQTGEYYAANRPNASVAANTEVAVPAVPPSAE